jgi:hypothetical protein
MSERRPTTESELVELIRAIDVPAPEALHRRVDTLIAGRSAGASRRAARAREPRSFGLRPRLAAGGAIAAALLAMAIVIGVSGGGSSTLSVRDAAALTLRPAITGPPAESHSKRSQLTATVDGVSFPYWGAHFGWHSTGSRSDHVDGRTVTTIFYENSRGHRVGYAIVGGSAAPATSGGVVSRHDGTPYRLLTVNGVAVVSWVRAGHLCVISGHGVSGATLLRMASWDDRRSVAS